MTRADLAALTKPDAVVAWTRAKFEFLETGLIEDGRPVRLEAVIFKPDGAGPFPLAVINHGSTGRGRDPALFTQTWFAADLAGFLNERGWLVAFPQRRGRGKSDGLYDEGFRKTTSLVTPATPIFRCAARIAPSATSTQRSQHFGGGRTLRRRLC
jgi:dienelactone hydrolase